MEFIIDNYIWFIAGAIVLLMTLVGYVAERTDFGHRKVDEVITKKKRKEERLKKDKEKLKNSSLKLNDVVYENGKEAEKKVEPTSLIDEWESPFENPTQEVASDNLNLSIEEPVEENTTINNEDTFVDNLTENSDNSIASMNEDLNAPLPAMKTPTVSMNEEDLNVPLPEMNIPTSNEVEEIVPEVESTQVMEELNEIKKADNSVEIVDENISPVENIAPAEVQVLVDIPKEEIKEELLTEEDNIWKF